MTDDARTDDVRNFDDELAVRLRDPAKRLELWQRMNPGYGHSLTTPSGTTSAFAPHLTPSGTNGADQPLPPLGGTLPASLPGTPAWWMMPPCPPFFTPFPVPPSTQPGSSTHPIPIPLSTPTSNSGGTVTPQPLASEEEETHEEDHVEIHDNDEANLFAEFDPIVESPGTWDPPMQMSAFLEKHFNRELDDKSREAILENYPKPNCSALVAPRIDEEAATQMKRNFKNVYFGAEKALYKIQDRMLEVAGPLACLWSDMVNPDAKVDKEEIALVVQRALVLLGGTSHAISVERRKIAWARINPKLKSLATEDYKDREDRLFGPGFLEKATKKLETDKALAKVTAPPSEQQKRPFQEDKTDLRSFLSKGAPSKYGYRGTQRQNKPYNSTSTYKQGQYKQSQYKQSQYKQSQYKQSCPTKKPRQS